MYKNLREAHNVFENFCSIVEDLTPGCSTFFIISLPSSVASMQVLPKTQETFPLNKGHIFLAESTSLAGLGFMSVELTEMAGQRTALSKYVRLLSV
jgi:hypothetical protein